MLDKAPAAKARVPNSIAPPVSSSAVSNSAMTPVGHHEESSGEATQRAKARGVPRIAEDNPSLNVNK